MNTQTSTETFTNKGTPLSKLERIDFWYKKYNAEYVYTKGFCLFGFQLIKKGWRWESIYAGLEVVLDDYILGSDGEIYHRRKKANTIKINTPQTFKVRS